MIMLFRFALMAIFTLGLAGCNDSWTWHQKITVSVDTPEGVKTASSVMKARLAEKSGWWAPPEATGADRSLSGEAVVLEVAPGRYLFALLSSIPMAHEIYFPGGAPLEVAGRLENSRETRKLNGKQYPLLVTFGDILDPASVERVDPAHLEASFGPGYRLISINMTITSEPQTEGQVERVLVWLEAVGKERANLKGKPPKGLVSDQPDPQIYMIAPSDFSTELYE